MLKNFLGILIVCLFTSISQAGEPNFKVVSASVPAKSFSLTEATPVQPRIFTLPVLSAQVEQPAKEQPAKEETTQAEVIVQEAPRVVHQSVPYPVYQSIGTPVYSTPIYQQAYPQIYPQVYTQPLYRQPVYTAPSYNSYPSGICTPRG